MMMRFAGRTPQIFRGFLRSRSAMSRKVIGAVARCAAPAGRHICSSKGKPARAPTELDLLLGAGSTKIPHLRSWERVPNHDIEAFEMTIAMSFSVRWTLVSERSLLLS